MVEGALNAQSRVSFVCVCVHALPFDQPPQPVQPHKRVQSLSLCSFSVLLFGFLCMLLVSGRERTANEWAFACRRENYKVALYHVCGRVKNAVIVCLETLNVCLADAQTSLCATEVL